MKLTLKGATSGIEDNISDFYDRLTDKQKKNLEEKDSFVITNSELMAMINRGMTPEEVYHLLIAIAYYTNYGKIKSIPAETIIFINANERAKQEFMPIAKRIENYTKNWLSKHGATRGTHKGTGKAQNGDNITNKEDIPPNTENSTERHIEALQDNIPFEYDRVRIFEIDTGKGNTTLKAYYKAKYENNIPTQEQFKEICESFNNTIMKEQARVFINTGNSNEWKRPFNEYIK